MQGGEPLSMAPARSLQKMNSKMAELSKDIAEFTEDKQATIKKNEVTQTGCALKDVELIPVCYHTGAGQAREIEADGAGSHRNDSGTQWSEPRCRRRRNR